MIKVGLTGGIGSGKTTVAKIFEEIGIPVYYADSKAKTLMQTDKNIREKIIKHFGKDSFIKDKLNNKYLANIVFKDKKQLKILEKIVHPVVINDFLKWAKKQTSPYVIVENAIMVKTGMDKYLDYIIYVDAPINERIKRVIERDEISENDVKLRINQQNKENKLLNKAYFLINNNNNKDLLVKEVKNIDKKLNYLLKKS